jgi:abortive infection bacteriophage resistance protein
MTDFSDSEFMAKELEKANKTIEKSFVITTSLLSTLPKNNDLRIVSILVGASFELIFDVILEFRFRTDRFSKDFMINKKREIISSEGILNEMYNSDLKQIIEIRNHCSHNIEIDEKEIKMRLHGTKTYQRNISLMKGLTLGAELRQVSTLILNTFHRQCSQYIVNHLNKLEGWH